MFCRLAKRILFFIGFSGCLSAEVSGQGASVAFEELWRADDEMDFEVDEPEMMDTAQLSVPLTAYDSPFAAMSRYNFSFVRYSRRGYDWSFSRRTLNGIDLYDPVTGNSFWGILSALNETPGREIETEGFARSFTSIGSEGGIREFYLDPLDEPLSSRIGWMFTDRRFRHGFRVSATTGEMEGGWAVLAAGSRRWGRDRHVGGVYADDWSLTLSLSKRLGKRSNLSVSFLVAPTERGLRSASVQEAFDATGDLLYNPAWGYQQGRERSSRVRDNTQPMALATWNYQPDERWKVSVSYAALWGTTAQSMLDWYDANSPTPDYYRYLPSYFDNPQVSEAVLEAWRSRDPKVTQIAWEELYAINRNRDSLDAAYVLGSAVRRYFNQQLVGCFSYTPSRILSLSGGLRMRADRMTASNRIDDLLGASGLYDIDPYLIDDQYFGDKLQNDLRYPDRIVRVGDDYGYHYDIRYASCEGWFMADLRNRRNERFGGYVGLRAALIGFDRVGHYEKELFPGTASYGASERQRFTEYTVQGGVSYLFSPKHRIGVDLLYGDVAPAAEDVFVSVEYRNRTIDHPRPTNRLGGEVTYRFSGRLVGFEVRGYLLSTRGENTVRQYYDDVASVFSDMVITDMDKLYAGVELGCDIALTDRFALRTAFAQARNTYRNDPMVRIYSDKDGSVVAPDARSYLRGYRLGGSPQRVAAAELSYQGVRMWRVAVSVNYVADNYVSLSPLNRMSRVFDYAASPEDLERLVTQERFPETFTINLFAYKTFRLGRGYLTVSGSVNNLANRRRIVYSGYEQMRLKRTGTGVNRSIEPFGSKYLYAYPRTYYLTMSFRF